jgi:hypothetical protein
MGLKIGSIAADLAAESEGEWVDIAEWPGVRLRVRSINYKLFQNAREMAYAKLTKALGRQPLTSEFAPKLAKLVQVHLLLEWDGLDDDNDKPLPYSSKLADEMYTDPRYRELVSQTIWAATRVGDRDAEFTTAATKNSAPPSATI